MEKQAIRLLLTTTNFSTLKVLPLLASKNF